MYRSLYLMCFSRLPKGQVSCEVEQSTQRPVDIVAANLSSGSEVGVASREAQPLVKDQRHPCTLEALQPAMRRGGGGGEEGERGGEGRKR